MTTQVLGEEAKGKGGETATAILDNVTPSFTPSSYEEGFITIYTGLRGSGKSCLLTKVALEAMSCWKRPTYSDFPIAGYVMGEYYEVQPLPNDFFVTYGRTIPRGSIIIVDELKEFFNRQEWFTTESKLGVSLFGQFRKLDFWLFGAMQFFHNLNTSVAQQVDVLIRCQDLHKTGWGHDLNVGKGVETYLNWYDLSGEASPDGKSARADYNPHMITGPAYRNSVVYIKAYREYFDTTRLTALERRFQKFKIQKTEIEVSGDNTRSMTRAQTRHQLKLFLTELVSSFPQEDLLIDKNGNGMIKHGKIGSMVEANGFSVSDKDITACLGGIGLKQTYLRRGPGGEGQYYIVPAKVEPSPGFSPVSDDVKDAWLGTERGQRGKKQGAQIFPD